MTDPTPPAPQTSPVASDPPVHVPELSLPQVTELAEQILSRVGTVVVGMEEVLRTAVATILAGGHILFEDVPGLGKTLVARALSGALGLDFNRVQCTPDLLPSDITGSSLYNPASHDFTFRPGPVFTNLLLADEINRTPPKTQSALLEAMAERQVSVEGSSLALPHPFHVLATSNPVEYEGTYPLPEAQLDRFMVRLSVGYPSDEFEVISRRLSRQREFVPVEAVTTPEIVLGMQQAVENAAIDTDIVHYCVALTAATRQLSEVEVGASPRGTQALVLLARARAVIDGRDYALPEDVKAVAVPVLAHRLTLTPAAWTSGVNRHQLVAGLLSQVPTPSTSR